MIQGNTSRPFSKLTPVRESLVLHFLACAFTFYAQSSPARGRAVMGYPARCEVASPYRKRPCPGKSEYG